MVGLCWRNIADAVGAKVKDLPEPERQKKTEDLIKDIYYVYIFLDQYAHLDDLRSRGFISPSDDKIVEWKRANLPNLMGSEVGRWMLENNLTEYYSRKDERRPATGGREAQFAHRSRSQRLARLRSLLNPDHNSRWPVLPDFAAAIRASENPRLVSAERHVNHGFHGFKRRPHCLSLIRVVRVIRGCSRTIQFVSIRVHLSAVVPRPGDEGGFVVSLRT